jgi:hypothetical protein
LRGSVLQSPVLIIRKNEFHYLVICHSSEILALKRQEEGHYDVDPEEYVNDLIENKKLFTLVLGKS